MGQSNEFKGRNLAEAAREATAAYHTKSARDSDPFCKRLRSRMDANYIELDRLFDRMIDLRREVQSLQRSAAIDDAVALASSAAASIRSLSYAMRALKKIRSIKLGRDALRNFKFNFRDLFTAIVAAATALSRHEKISEARYLQRESYLQREIDRMNARFQRVHDEILDLSESYVGANCHLR